MQENEIESQGQPTLEIGSRRALLRHRGKPLARFRAAHVDALDLAAARALVDDADVAQEPLVAVFRTASPQARRLLRAEGVSYAGEDGEWFLHAPPVFVERPARLRAAATAPAQAPGSSPFALRASRVPRWLLLNAEGSASLAELSRALELSEATVSRVTRELSEQGLVELERGFGDARMRRVRARDTAGLLAQLERAAWSRRVVRQSWDVGAQNVVEALARWRDAAANLPKNNYALGGLAGAATLARAVEPSSALVWVHEQDLRSWSSALLAEPERPRPGTVTVQAVRDPFVLGLAEERDGLRVADPVQLYLDCRLAGERALEAAEAIRRKMRW
jgi:DNA-binding transcriptional ArsR family regulator